LRNAVAAGAANALEFGAGRFPMTAFVALRENVKTFISN